ncbi:PIG-L family deacetylase [Kitasatospora sp. NPDC057965]|uniref:PIG-L family deacetylase n=1 Tax=Kitasatospora sp. NPDC057965 TaxID=3346291 RepID=UPI0036D97725
MRFPKIVGTLLVAALSAPQAPVGATPKDLTESATAAVASAASGDESFLQIVAHQDDDILFMNPDLNRQYAAPSVTVYLTGGETPGTSLGSPCAYSESRNSGARAAHARLAGVAEPTWSTTALRLTGGKTVQLDTLDQAPQIKLVFLRLHEGGDGNYPDGGNRATLDTLFTEGSGGPSHQSTLGSLPADGECDPAYAHQDYTHDELVATLTELMERFRPTVLRAQDPRVPYGYSRDPLNPADHADHIAAARFAGKAALGYHGPDGNGRVILRNYRDYNVRMEPPNLPASSAKEKKKTFLAYLGPKRPGTGGGYSGAYDPQPNPDEANFYADFPSRQYPRWSNGTAWAAQDGTGTLNAFAVLDNRVQAWRESGPGGAWSGPVPVPGGEGLAAALGVVRDAAGLIHLFGVRLDDDRIVTVAQTAPGSWGDWTVLGNPDRVTPGFIGSPVPVLGGDGRLTVFVRNAGGGVSALGQLPDGGWPADWTDLGGTQVRDGLAAALATDGRVELFAPTRDGIGHWRQSAPGGPFVRDAAFLGPPPAGPLTTSRTADGRLGLFFHQAGTGQVVTRYVRPNGSWTTTPESLGGPAGLEGVAAVTGTDGRTTVAIRNAAGGISLASQPAANRGSAASWSDLGRLIVGAPTVALDAVGHRVVLALGPDAVLRTARQSGPGADSPFDPWQAAGN